MYPSTQVAATCSQEVQIIGIRVLLWFISLFFRLDTVTWDDKIIDGLHFIEEYVLQVPLFLMTLMRYATPTLDNLYELFFCYPLDAWLI